MSIILDTNACIAIINLNPSSVRQRFRQARRNGETVVMSGITLFELWFGIANSARTRTNEEDLSDFRRLVDFLPFDDEDARTAGYLRVDLAKIGKPIGTYDLLIASQALRRDFLLITANVREFSRVPGLRWEDWSLPL